MKAIEPSDGTAARQASVPAARKAARRRQLRRHFLVDRKTQVRFTVKFLLLVYVVLAVQETIAHVHLVGLQATVMQIPASRPEAATALDRELQLIHRRFHLAIAGYLVAVAAVLASTGVLTSHRLAGPVLRLKRHLAEHPFGTGSTIHFRRSDHLEELHHALRDSTRALDERRQELVRTLDELAERMHQLARESSADAAFELVEEIEELTRTLTAFMEASAPTEPA